MVFLAETLKQQVHLAAAQHPSLATGTKSSCCFQNATSTYNCKEKEQQKKKEHNSYQIEVDATFHKPSLVPSKHSFISTLD
jgi:hypothetical protein